jgi:hypothetical protein
MYKLIDLILSPLPYSYILIPTNSLPLPSLSFTPTSRPKTPLNPLHYAQNAYSNYQSISPNIQNKNTPIHQHSFNA